MSFQEYEELNRQVEDNSKAIVRYVVENNEDLLGLYNTMIDTGIDELQAYATVVTLLLKIMQEE
ncbi:TPA: hypothetical protein IYI19_002900, partial [Enterococcus faecium]|uniref:hypothetical protein n=1 Tax=Bacteria TaxID=2 RepID=UPI000709E668|nr:MULTISPECIES: hypothetical protein [Bacteria]HAR0503992.1 hypothetical protein [Enterococcus faecium]MCG2105276.1 hypothetical protein [Staphylococcus epidermidis]MCG2123577.1 hypothetical protein [Staphylococcus epidermidis]HAR0507210.1 hypothetical protein [Enterococcus faecium]HAR0522050.1 hypothetical protein [Enterococcus faecium]